MKVLFTSRPKVPRNFRSERKIRSLHAFLQVVLAITLLFFINYLAATHFTRIDLTKEKRFSLSPETLAHLEQMEETVHIYLTSTEETQEEDIRVIFENLKNLLREYEYASRRSREGRIIVEHIDVYRDRTRARELTSQYGPLPENIVLVAHGNRRRQIFMDEIFLIEKGKVTGFKGEQVISSAILEVISDQDARVYFSAGHGEMRIDSTHPVRGMSAFEQMLNQRGIQTGTIDLTTVSSLPEDARLVVVAGPTARFREAELQKLRRFQRDRDGGVILLLEPGAVNELDPFLAEWGIVADDMLLVDPGPDFQRGTGDLIVRRFAEHPITSIFPELQVSLLTGLPRPIRIDEEKIRDPESLQLTTLMTSSDSSWGDAGYREGDRAVFEEGRDMAGPLGIAVAGRRFVDGIAGLTLPNARGGRIIVVGSADFASNNHFHSYGNQFFMLNAVNWGMDRRASLNIPPRPVQQNMIVLSETSLRQILLWTLSPAGFFLLVGAIVFLIRR